MGLQDENRETFDDALAKANALEAAKIKNAPQSPAPLSVEDIGKIEGMTADELKALVYRMARQCGTVACKDDTETAQAMLDVLAETALRPIAPGVNMRADIQARMGAIDKWLDRTKGKPAQYIHQVNEHISKAPAYELTNDQLTIELRKLSALGSLPEGVLMLEDGTITIENDVT